MFSSSSKREDRSRRFVSQRGSDNKITTCAFVEEMKRAINEIDNFGKNIVVPHHTREEILEEDRLKINNAQRKA